MQGVREQGPWCGAEDGEEVNVEEKVEEKDETEEKETKNGVPRVSLLESELVLELLCMSHFLNLLELRVLCSSVCKRTARIMQGSGVAPALATYSRAALHAVEQDIRMGNMGAHAAGSHTDTWMGTLKCVGAAQYGLRGEPRETAVSRVVRLGQEFPLRVTGACFEHATSSTVLFSWSSLQRLATMPLAVQLRDTNVSDDLIHLAFNTAMCVNARGIRVEVTKAPASTVALPVQDVLQIHRNDGRVFGPPPPPPIRQWRDTVARHEFTLNGLMPRAVCVSESKRYIVVLDSISLHLFDAATARPIGPPTPADPRCLLAPNVHMLSRASPTTTVAADLRDDEDDADYDVVIAVRYDVFLERANGFCADVYHIHPEAGLVHRRRFPIFLGDATSISLMPSMLVTAAFRNLFALSALEGQTLLLFDWTRGGLLCSFAPPSATLCLTFALAQAHDGHSRDNDTLPTDLLLVVGQRAQQEQQQRVPTVLAFHVTAALEHRTEMTAAHADQGDAVLGGLQEPHQPDEPEHMLAVEHVYWSFCPSDAVVVSSFPGSEPLNRVAYRSVHHVNALSSAGVVVSDTLPAVYVLDVRHGTMLRILHKQIRRAATASVLNLRHLVLLHSLDRSRAGARPVSAPHGGGAGRVANSPTQPAPPLPRIRLQQQQTLQQDTPGMEGEAGVEAAEHHRRPHRPAVNRLLSCEYRLEVFTFA